MSDQINSIVQNRISKADNLFRLAQAVGQLQAQIGNMGYNPQRGEPAGFFDLKAACKDANHTPPHGISVPPDKGYRHVCPGCGFSFEIRGS